MRQSRGAVGMLASVGRKAGLRSIMAIGVLLGITAGIGLGCIAGARRTDSLFARHLDATDAAHVEIDPGWPDPEADRAIRALPGVVDASYWAIVNAYILDDQGAIDMEYVGPLAFTTDGRYLEMDRVVVSRGRLLDPEADDEVMLNDSFAGYLGVDVGDRVPIGLFPADPDGYPLSETPVRRSDATVVGIMALNEDVAAETFDAIPRMFVSPAFEPPADADLSQYYGFAWYGLRLEDGDAGVDSVIQAWRDAAAAHSAGDLEDPSAWLTYTHRTQDLTRKVDRAVRPLVIALTGFGALVFLAAVVLSSQSMSRSVRQGWDDLRTGQVLGLTPREAARAGMAVPISSIVLALVIAAITAVLVSGRFPMGAYSVLEPSPGIEVDPIVLGLGLAVLAAVPLVVAAVVCRHQAATGATNRGDSVTRPSRLVARAARLGGPPSVVAALRLTAEPGRGRAFVPTRSVIVSTVVAVSVAVTALVFGANLQAVVDQPARFGWQLDALLVPDGGYSRVASDVVEEWAATRDDVAGWRVVGADLTTVAGLETPGVMYGPWGGRGESMVPVIVSGRAPQAGGEIVLGAATLDATDAQVGDQLTVGAGGTERELTVTGTAVFPVLGPALASRTGLDRGAWLSSDDADLFASLTAYGQPFNFVALALDPDADLVDLNEAADQPPFVEPDSGTDNDVFDVVEPSEVASAATASRLQRALVVSVGALAALSMLLTLLAVVRRRGVDLAVYRALGFTPGQLRMTILGQGLCFGVAAIVVGVPMGVIVGRELWRRFATELGVVPDPLTPWGGLAVLVAVVLVASVLSAIWPAAVSTRRPAQRDVVVPE